MIHGAFCDQPWSGNEAGDDPIPYSGGWQYAAHTAHTVCACPMFCFVALLPAIRELIFQYFAEQEKIQQNATYNAEIHEIPVKTRKTNPVRLFLTRNIFDKYLSCLGPKKLSKIFLENITWEICLTVQKYFFLFLMAGCEGVSMRCHRGSR